MYVVCCVYLCNLNDMHSVHLSLASTLVWCVCDCSSVSPDQLDILQNFSRDGLPTSLAEIGREISVNFTVTNNGPSAIGRGRLTIYLPYRSPCTVNGFLFYITSVSVCLPYTYIYLFMCLFVVYVHMYIRRYVHITVLT